MRALSDSDLKDKTAKFRARLAAGEKLDALLPEAFAAVREASCRVLGMRHFDVQLVSSKRHSASGAGKPGIPRRKLVEFEVHRKVLASSQAPQPQSCLSLWSRLLLAVCHST